MSERTLRTYARVLEGCTVCARGLGLRLAFVAPDLDAIPPFVNSALHQILVTRTPPMLAVSGLSFMVEIVPIAGEQLNEAQLDLASRLSQEATERGYIPRLSRGRARRPLETARRRRDGGYKDTSTSSSLGGENPRRLRSGPRSPHPQQELFAPQLGQVQELALRAPSLEATLGTGAP
jgi:hypothetical protein